ncbi:coiled-coil domain-containing protein 171-like [Lingula anatina]|uniref:Coiled-coil domain-containing protein 171-like n=1 Tax=Lingula anatina TaxID=7574 RepID=A0A1S3GYD1_LINAN|nr:coiled-coil domain-containing protein 171-like [Lingula anatina]|eukprot:XP_013378672.1 coiled-coil domain-containing protein 171-like [Lingula anatina]
MSRSSDVSDMSASARVPSQQQQQHSGVSTTTTGNYSPVSTLTGSGDSLLMTPSNEQVLQFGPSEASTSQSTSQMTGVSQMAASPGIPNEDGGSSKEVMYLRNQLKQMRAEIQTEQDTVKQLRRRLNTVEKERLEFTSRSNEQTADLESQVAKFRAQLEKGEATRQSLEFELAKARREAAQERRSAEDREAMMSSINDNMKEKLTEINLQTADLQKQLKEFKQSSEQETANLNIGLQEKEQIIASYQTEQDILQTEKEKLENIVAELEGNIADLSEKVQHLEDECKAQAEGLRRHMNDLDFAREREDRLKADYETALQRIHTLEESIEAERATHLQSKFNSEIIQLRVRDVEAALELEKTTKNEIASDAERQQKQLRELEQAYTEERKMSKHTRDKFERLEKEYANVKHQLTSEVEDKKAVISNLSKQLELHQKNFDDLKEELAKAKKRQIYLEETYGGSMRELELLIQNFQVEPTPKKKRDKKDKPKPLAPSVVLETLRHTLLEYKKRLDATSSELQKVKSLTENLSKEGDSYKDMIWAKDKALEETQQGYRSASKELQRLRQEYSELEATLATFKVDAQTITQRYEKEATRAQELEEEMMRVTKKHDAEIEDHYQYLRSLYHKLLSAESSQYQSPASTEGMSWVDLTVVVQEYSAALLNKLYRTQEKLQHLEKVITSKDETMDAMQRAHEDQVDKLSRLAEEQELDWQRQKQDLEEHYNRLLGEVHTRSKKTQVIADQAWEKIRQTGTVQQGLEAECAELRARLAQKNQEHGSLLTACALLCGAYYPLFTRAQALAAQRNLLEIHSRHSEEMKEQAQTLVETLSAELGADNELSFLDPSRKRRRPLLKFRTAAIVVIAANRLNYLCHSSARLFVSYTNRGSSGMLVCAGRTPQSSRRVFTGVGLSKSARTYGGGLTAHSSATLDERMALSWLTSSDLLKTVLSSMTDVQQVLDQLQQAGASDPRLLVKAAKSSFHRLLDKLGPYFGDGSEDGGFSARGRGGSLTQYLDYGLRRVISNFPTDGTGQFMTMEGTMTSLNQHILDFTARLHKAEVDRRNLKLELNQSKQESSALKHSHSKSKILEEEVAKLRQEGQQMVQLDRFDSVCQELESALKREMQAQQLLNEQSDQLHSLSRKLDIQASEGSEKEKTLSEAVQGLSEARQEIRRTEQTVRQLNKHVQQLEEEKRILQDNVFDAENTLRTVAKDKSGLATYLKAVESALAQSKQEMILSRGFRGREFSLSKVLLSSDLLPADTVKPGPELIACQNLVSVFVDAQHQAFSKILALEEEIESSKRHISTLKQELNAACQREYEDHGQGAFAEKSYVSRGGRGIYDMGPDRNGRETFAPLVEDPDPTMSYLRTPGGRSFRESPIQDKTRSPYQTSQASNLQPRPFRVT